MKKLEEILAKFSVQNDGIFCKEIQEKIWEELYRDCEWGKGGPGSIGKEEFFLEIGQSSETKINQIIVDYC